MAVIVFARSYTGIVGSNPTQDMDVCVRLFCIFVVLGIWRRSDPPSKKSYRLHIGIKTLKAAKAQNRAVEP
jgi:hypothetical protein